ncbi:Polycystin-2 [Armadillidium nasatum]|uniref:Polycystin-2 n=1 Tax=Armadillidium nasatum TaxID=96803 RepID=A0A5N5T959_9CRUS|nr:Polycystin-2 [Armadillidium nasatum]
MKKFEDKSSYGDMNGTAWTYHENEELDSSSYWGQIDTYSGAGFYIDFGTDKNSTKTMLAELREKLWIDRGTRVVFIDFTVYNANINYFCVINTPDDYANFQQLGYWQVQFNSTIAVCVFFAWFKLFKYISFNKTMTQLFSTLSRVSDFSSFINAVFTLLRTILGDFNFQAIEEANRILGPLFFLSYVFFVFFVLLNMFLAIINDTYSEVKSEIASQKNEFEIADYFKRGYNNMLGKFGRRDKLIDIENALKLSDHSGDGRLSFDECRKNLKKCNFSDMEIEMFFARYDIDGNRLLEPEEIKRMLSDLECKRNEIDSQQKPLVIHQEAPPSAERPKSAQSTRPRTGRNIGPGVSQDEFLILQKRVDGIENNLGSVVNKIDVVLLKLDSMEKSKHKRNEHMGKMFDEIIEGDDEDRIPPPN